MKRTAENIFYIFLIVLILGYNVYAFLIAPNLDREQTQNQIVEKYNREVTILNQFDDYLVVREKDEIVFLTDDGTPKYRFNYIEPKTSYLSKSKLQYGVHRNKLIFIESNSDEEIWIDSEDQTIILRQEWN